MPAIFKNDEQLINNMNIYINNNRFIKNSIDRQYCDILFNVDATSSMGAYIKASNENCENIIERINLLYGH